MENKRKLYNVKNNGAKASKRQGSSLEDLTKRKPGG